MESLHSELIADKNLDRGGESYAILLDVTLTDGTHLRFTTDNQDTTYLTETYQAFPFEIDDVSEGMAFETRSFQIRVWDPNRTTWAYVDSADGGIDADVTLYFISLGHLALGSDNLFAQFDLKVVSVRCSRGYVVFTVEPDVPFNKQFPKNEINYLHCPWEFKQGRCGYTGAESTCDHTFTQCKEYDNLNNFGGCPSMGSYGISVYE